MPEIALAAGIGVVLALGALLKWASLGLLLGVGALLMALGVVAELPAGLLYHLALHRALASEGGLAPRWWLRPSSFHHRLSPSARRRVLPWFYAGAAGFVVFLLGALLVTAGALVQRASSP